MCLGAIVPRPFNINIRHAGSDSLGVNGQPLGAMFRCFASFPSPDAHIIRCLAAIEY